MEERPRGSPFAVPAAFTLIAGSILGWYYYGAALVSSRPSVSVTRQVTIGDQHVPARLWQDPFKAVGDAIAELQEDRRKLAGKPFSEAELAQRFGFTQTVAQQVQRRAAAAATAATGPATTTATAGATAPATTRATATDEAILVLPVFVDSAPYAESAEWRLRARYAVLSALAAAGYVPEDGQHVGHFVVGWSFTSDFDFSKGGDLPRLPTEESRPVLVVPYEWFARDPARTPAAKHANVLVMWLADDAFADLPVSRLEQLLALFAGTPVKVAVLGPDNSTTLQAAVTDKGLLAAKLEKRRATRWYASRPTAPDASIYGGNSKVRRAGRELQLLPSPATGLEQQPSQQEPLLRITRTTNTDDELVKEILEELKRRGVDPDAGDCVALVTEWDTLYGRTLPETFKAAIKPPKGVQKDVLQYSYLRGLDGITGAQAAAAASAAAPANQRAGQDASGKMPAERPDGPAQLDYIRRIARRIADDDRYRWYGQRERITAIGVLGSDVYDKLLVLRALHGQFPDTLLFTTDLDNRLLHQGDLPYTQNALVASAYGLSLTPGLQRGIPPFRDAYQTGLFASCLEALGDFVPPERMPPPRLFEIGRRGAYNLSVGDPAFHEPRPARLGASDILKFLVWLCCIALFVAFVLLPLTRFWRKGVERHLETEAPQTPEFTDPKLEETAKRLRTSEEARHGQLLVVFVAYTVVMLVMVLIIYFSQGEGTGEPFALADGISVWPTELMRLTAVFLAAAFLVHAAHDLYRNQLQVAHRFGLPSPSSQQQQQQQWQPSVANPLPTAWKKVQEWRKRRMSFTVTAWKLAYLRFAEAAACAPPGRSLGRPSVPLLWREYLDYGSERNRAWRVVPQAVAFVVAGVLLIRFLGQPLRPFRGTASDFVDRGVIVLTVAMLVLLTFFVLDAIRLCDLFCKNLAGEGAPWPKDLLEPYAKARGMNADDLPEWMDVRLIAQHTVAVGQLVYYPFILLAVILVSRTPLFDRWRWPLGLLIVLAWTCLYTVWSVITLRRSAERARRSSIDQLNWKLIRIQEDARVDIDPSLGAAEQASLRQRRADAESRAKQIVMTIEEIKSTHEGAFAPLQQHPLIGALLIPAGGAGLLSLVELLAKAQ